MKSVRSPCLFIYIYIWYTTNTTQQFLFFNCVPQSDKTTCRTFMVCLCICAGSVGIWCCGTFCQTRHNSVNVLCFRGKVSQSLDYGSLQDGALCRRHQSAAHCAADIKVQCTVPQTSKCSALCRRHQSAVHMCRIFKCCHGLFVALFLTYIYIYIYRTSIWTQPYVTQIYIYIYIYISYVNLDPALCNTNLTRSLKFKGRLV